MTKKSDTRWFAAIGPGLLVAATGVGAGDLATASFTGVQLGVAVLWVVALGAAIKFVLNEGLARYQLATGDTILEGCSERLGRPFHFCFLLYLLPWSVFVGAALMGACGVTAHAILPVMDEPARAKIVFGIAHSMLGVALVRIGGYGLFERVMRLCIGVMFVTVVVTAVLVRPEWPQVFRGLLVPTIPQFHGAGLGWTVALMGGVGGTLTVLCYGYWIREEGRENESDLRVCRIDLGVGYGMTALFGMAMVIIGSQVEVEGKGAGLIVALADRLEGSVGVVGRWAFLLGAWGAVFSSLLGVWQAVPYIFADFVSLALREPKDARSRRVSTRSPTYRWFLYALAVVPIIGLRYGFRDIQKYYAVIGAAFMPFLAAVLLYLNGHASFVGHRMKNRPATTVVLAIVLTLFCVAGWFSIRATFPG